MLPSVTQRLSKHAQLAQKAAEQSALVHALSLLQAAFSSIASAKEMLQSGRLHHVVAKWNETDQAVNGPVVDDWIRATTYWQNAARSLEDIQKQTKDRLHEAVNSCIKLSFPSLQILSETEGNHTLPLHDLSSPSIGPVPLPLSVLLDSMSSLNLLQPFLITLSNTLLKTYIEPYLSSPSYFRSSPSLELIPSPEASRLDSLHVFTDYLAQHLPILPLLADSLLLLVIKSVLQPALPTSTSPHQLEEFYALLNRMKEFETTIHSSVISNWAKDLDRHWVQGINSYLATQMRGIVLARDQWEGKMVTFQPVSKGWFPVLMEEEDAWGFDSSPVIVQKPLQVTNVEKEEEAGWEFDEPVLEQTPEVPEDAWGFEEPVEEEIAKEPLVEKGKQKAEDQDGWGFEDEIPVSPFPDNHTQAASQISPIIHSKESSWEWEAESGKEKGHQRTRSRGRRKEKSPAQPAVPEEECMISSNSEKVVALARDVFDDLCFLTSSE